MSKIVKDKKTGKETLAMSLKERDKLWSAIMKYSEMIWDEELDIVNKTLKMEADPIE